MDMSLAFTRTATLILVFTVAVEFLRAADATTWPRFRGNNGDGVGEMADPPVKWTEQDFAWRTPIPGTGHSSPVLWDQRLFVTSADNKTADRFVLCLDATDGRVRWTQRFPANRTRRTPRKSFATSTPAVDARHVYCCWSVPDKYSLMALDHEGKLIWETQLQAPTKVSTDSALRQLSGPGHRG